MKVQKTKITFFYWVMQASCLAAAAAQIFISLDPTNISSVLLSALASTFLIQYLIRSNCAQDTPLSTLALIGLNLTSLTVSLVSMSVYGRPFVQDLRTPELTFSILSSLQIISVLIHWAYRSFKPLHNAPQVIAESVFKPIGLFTTPHIAVVWILGGLGAFSQIVGYADTGDVGGKAIQALSFLCWMPFLIPFYYANYGEDFCNLRKQIIFVIGFIILMILIGLARNVRQIMMIGPMQLLFAYFIYASQRPSPYKYPKLIYTVGGAIVFFVGVHFAAELATAMVVAREKRETSTPAEMIEDTAQILFNERHRITQYRDKFELAASLSFYDESYIPNPVLGRLSETKFHDNMIYFGSNFSNEQIDDLLTGMYNKVTTILPENITKSLIKNYDKNDYIYSTGDYYLYIQTGQHRLSSFVTGSIWADFFTLFKWWYPIIAGAYILAMFIFIDSMTLTTKSGVAVSAVGICTSWMIFIYGIGGESIPAKLSMIFREVPQRIALYLIFFWALHITLQFFGIKRPDQK